MPSLMQIKYALALAQEGGFIEAARKSFVTQPTLSMQIQKLEEELRTLLFDRSKRPIVPTDAGHALLEQFRRVNSEYEKIFEIQKNLLGETSGRYSLGIIPTLAPSVLPEIISFFENDFPKVDFQFKELTTPQIVASLKTTEIDAGLLSTPIGDGQLREDFIFNEALVFIQSKGKPIFDFADIEPSELPFEKLVIMKEGHCLRNQVLDLCTYAHDRSSKKPSIEVASMSLLFNLVARGRHCAVVPKLMVEAASLETSGLSILQFKNPKPLRQISLATYHYQVKARLNDVLAQKLKKILPTHPEDAGSIIRLNPL